MSDVLQSERNMIYKWVLKYLPGCAAVRVPMQERGEMHPAVSEVQPQVKTHTNPTKATKAYNPHQIWPWFILVQKIMKLCRAECSDGSDEEDCSKWPSYFYILHSNLYFNPLWKFFKHRSNKANGDVNVDVYAEDGNVNSKDNVNAPVEFNVEDGGVNIKDNLDTKDNVNAYINVDVDIEDGNDIATDNVNADVDVDVNAEEGGCIRLRFDPQMWATLE